MLAAFLVIAAIVGFGLLVYTLIDREALGWKKAPSSAPYTTTASSRSSSITAQSAAQGAGRGASLLMLGVSIVVLGGMGAFAIEQTRTMGLAYQSATWSMTEGRMLHSTARYLRQRKSSGGYWQPQVFYTYTIDGRTYTGDVWRVYPNKIYDPAVAKQLPSRYPVGSIVRVSYDPENPTRAALEPGVVSVLDYLGVVFLLLWMLAMGVVGMMSLREVITPGDLQEGWESEAYLRYQADVLDAQYETPRDVPLNALIRLFYRPLDQMLRLLVVTSFAWLLSAPLIGTPGAPLAVCVGLGCAMLLLWPLARFFHRRYALRYGCLATAHVRYASSGLSPYGIATRLELTVRAPAGTFTTVTHYHGPDQHSMRERDVIRVLTDPSQRTILLVLPPRRSRYA